MPVFMFHNDRLYVVFDSAFEADLQEEFFDPEEWTRVSMTRFSMRADDDGSKRGNAFLSSDEPLSAFYRIYVYFENRKGK